MTGLPLTAAQAGIWTGQRLDPRSAVYNTAERVVIHGPVDVPAFEAALRETVAEAQALHARFVETPAGPRQLLDAVPEWSLRVADLTGEADPRAAADAALRADLATPVDLAAGPVFGQALLRTGPAEWVWGQRIHHIAVDGYGFSLLGRRVAQHYTALVGGRAPAGRPLAPLAPVLAADAAYEASAQRARDAAYWRALLADRPRPPTLSGRAAAPSATFLRHGGELPESTMERLRAVAAAAGADWPDVVVAAVAAYLHRSTGATDVVLGLPVMNRLGTPALRVPCLAMNIVPLRVRVEAGDTVADLVARVAAAARAGRAHHRYRYEALRRDLRLVGGDRRLFGPVVNVMPFDYGLRFGGHPATATNLSAGPVEDVSVALHVRGDAVVLDVDANPATFTPAEVAAHHEALATLLAPDSPRDLAVVHPGKSLQSLKSGCTTARSRGEGDVLEVIAARAGERPGAVAVREAGRAVPYRELLERARAVAAGLTARGVRPGDLVAVALPRGADAVAAFLGALWCGAAYLPLDPDGPPGRRDDVLADAAPALALTDLAELAAGAGEPPPRARVAAGDPAYVIYTSGSTGRPNGVVVPRGALAHFVHAATGAYGIGAGDVVLQFAPLHFDASVEEIFLTLCAGGTLVTRTAEMMASVPALLAACGAAGVTVLDLPTAYWHEVAYAVATGAAALPASVRLVIIGGEAALAERVRRWQRAVGRSVRLLNTYGPTEATVVATYADLTEPDPEGAVPIGRPLPGVGVAVLDGAGAPVPDGAVGELYLTGPTLATGYLRRPERDAERFGAPPGLPRAYRTGDLVRRRPDGQLLFAGRADDELKVSGHRVDPAEVETVLLRHPGVREAAVVGQPTGAGGTRLVAHVVPVAGAAGAGAAVSAAEVRTHARAALPAPLVPAAVTLVERLPRTPNGKIDRAALRTSTPALDGAVDLGAQTGQAERAPGHSAVVAVWRQVLGVAEVGPDDDFFELGGESLQTIQVANRLSVALGRQVPVSAVFQHPTPAALATHLATLDPAPGTGVVDSMLADAELPADVAPRGSARTAGQFRHVLLTGATGFVGVHLLARLLADTGARVTCLVRADDAETAADRLRAALRAQGLPARWAAGRVRAVPADLSRPGLGLAPQEYAFLAASCDTVLHAAASVSVVRGYASMRAVNVTGTAEVLRLAAAVCPAAVHHLSTIAVGPPEELAAEVPEAHLPAHAGLADGYQRGKWAAEQLVRQAGERGLPVAVYRLGRVVGAPGTGIVNPGDLVWRLLRAGVRAGALPDLDVAEVWTPVDYVARALVRLAVSTPADGTVYHLAPAAPVRFADVAAWLRDYGYRLPALPPPRWLAAVEAAGADDADVATLAFFGVRGGPGAGPPGQVPRLARVVADNAAKALAGSGVECPPVDRALLHAYLDRAVADGLFPPP